MEREVLAVEERSIVVDDGRGGTVKVSTVRAFMTTGGAAFSHVILIGHGTPSSFAGYENGTPGSRSWFDAERR